MPVLANDMRTEEAGPMPAAEDVAYLDGEDAAQPEEHPFDKLIRFQKMANVAEELSEQKLNEIGARVVEDYEIDEASRKDWKSRNEAAMDLALQVAEKKSWPWPNCANVKYPLMTVAALQFNARAYPAIVQGSRVVQGKVNGMDTTGEKRAKAERIALHMSYQCIEEMEEWEPDTDKLLLQLPIVGDVFRKTYFDPIRKRNCSRLVPALQLVVNNKAASLETAPRVTELFDLYPNEVEGRKRGGTYLDIDLPDGNEGEDEDAPIEFLEQHRLLDLDEDGYQEPYIVTVHRESERVVRIVPRWETEGVIVNDRDQIVSIKPVQYYTQYQFIPSPDGSFYSIGFGALLNPINETINSVLNQMLDAGTLANLQGGFIGRGVKMKNRGALSMTPGEYIPVDTGGGGIRENIVPFQFGGPSPVLFQLLGMLIEGGKDIASVKDVLTGENQGQNVPATTTLAMIEQGLKVFSAIYKRVHRALKSELKKLFRLNAIYLPPQQEFQLLGVSYTVKQADYTTDGTDVTPVSDPSVVTDAQKMGRMQYLLQFKDDPMFNGMEIRKRALEAAEIDGVEALLVQEPPKNPAMLAKMAELEMREKDIGAGVELKLAQAEKTKAEGMAVLSAIEADGIHAQLDALQKQLEHLVTAMGLVSTPGQPAGAPGGQPSGGMMPQGAPAPGMSAQPLEAREKGGPVNAGQPYLVGERGPEIMVPDQDGSVIPNNSAGQGMDGQYLQSIGLPGEHAQVASRYNTELSPVEQAQFADWMKQQSATKGRNLSMDMIDYDMPGFWKAGAGYAENGHGNDYFKKPNHPTFSDQSRWHGVDGNEGGSWDMQAKTFTPAATNMQNWSKQDLQRYFDKAEKDYSVTYPGGR